MAEVVRTNFAPFFQILKIIRALIVAPPSDNFQICSLCWKGLFFSVKTLQTASKSTTNADVLLNNATASLGTVKRPSVIYKHKRDGYRQQNVRQRQKLISIIDYEFMTSVFRRICSHFGDIQRQRMADLEIWVWGPSRSLKKVRFDRPCMTFY